MPGVSFPNQVGKPLTVQCILKLQNQNLVISNISNGSTAFVGLTSSSINPMKLLSKSSMLLTADVIKMLTLELVSMAVDLRLTHAHKMPLYKCH
ncbi:hypothetical protein CEXT_630831 [Caerostris extrusa]|uniref:Uncharacterized protein n=1 Tax=Caerostris extrusa TaxID=172846 RepID=A0AAV4VH21_CAEEX|nr:hypothetical protein CEXT_630831 [Caerostris extrusa]